MITDLQSEYMPPEVGGTVEGTVDGTVDGTVGGTVVETKSVEPSEKTKVERLSDQYWLRELDRINYKKMATGPPLPPGGSAPEARRRGVCRKCFRSDSQDMHLELPDDSHSIIELVFKGKESPPEKKRKIWVNIFQTFVNEKTKRSYVRKICRQTIDF